MTTAPAAEWFKTEREAYAYLVSLGYDISTGKFNTDKNAGQMICDGKRISKFSVLEYGLRLKKVTQSTNHAITADYSARREKADTEKAEHDSRISRVKAEDAERELDRTWLHRDEAVADLAAIIASLQQSLDHAVLAGSEAVILAAGGEVARAYDVSETINEMIIARAFNEVAAAGTLRVKFKDERDSE